MLDGEWKPILTTLALPPAGLLLLALLGLLVAAGRWRRTGLTLVTVSVMGLWFLSCHAVALLLGDALLPAYEPVRADQLARAQAIVVIGGGVQADAPEYGEAQPSPFTLGRLRYAAVLARRTGKPVAFGGGVGWAAVGTDTPPEAQVAARTMKEFGAELRWREARARDTAENARELRNLLGKDGVDRIALVTDSWHMPRSVLEFRRAGFEVVPAPTGFVTQQLRPALEWLPSAEGLAHSRRVLREALGIWVANEWPSSRSP